ncbi:hypothetical protein BDZ45DRAFT_781623 [Acephala macrosclerotiorum]|nr:hypothetical protein BDZ45DRAFT_781623 [Acephala macrosclerotiorum]
MDTPKIERDNEGKRRKRKNEGINRRIETLITKAYEIGKFDGVDVALTICKHGQYTTYKSKVHASWPPSIAEIQTAYPLPKNMIAEDIEKRLFKKAKKNLARKNKEEGKHLMLSLPAPV